MGIDRSRRITFEEVADLYNESRPSYPDELIEDIIQLSELKTDGGILEVGCGPGNATILFAQRGYKLLGIELGERLAQLARQRCASFPNTTIVQSAFDDYEISPHSFNLAFSAEAFHWIPPEIGYPKLMDSLKETGSIALFWHLDVDPQTEWSKAIDQLFQKIAPQFDNPLKSYSLEWIAGIVKQNFREHCCIEDVTVKSYNWSETISTDTYIKRMHTYSSHRGMSAELRAKLYTEIRNVINNFGGHIEKPMQTALFHARVQRG
ncbi:MAG TPA: class I SAM-dependent methyltransferase [Anaerolineales bacterium]